MNTRFTDNDPELTANAERKVYLARSADMKRRVAAQPSPRKAAIEFFRFHPTARKCNVWQHHIDPERGGICRVMFLGHGPQPTDYRDVTPKTLAALPDVDHG